MLRLFFYNKRCPGLSWLCGLLFAGPLFAQAPATDPAVFQPPQNLIDPAAIVELENELERPEPDLRGIADRARAQVQLYTGQFVRDRLIQDERNRSLRGVQDIDEDIARLIALLQSKKYGQIQFLGEYPYLYRLHFVLGRAYEALDDPERALAEYLMALRYTGREQSWQTNPDAIEQEQRYLLMARTFADPDRLAQIAPGEERQAGESFRPLLERYGRQTLALQEAERQIFVAEAARLRGAGGDPAAARNERDRLRAEVEGLRNQLEAIRSGAYARYHQQKRSREGDIAYRLALLARRLETENRLIQRVLNRSSFYRGSGSQLGEERTALRKFVGYQMFLELAHEIDPENLVYLDLLADECRSSRQIEAAIAYQERYLELAVARPTPPDNLPEQYVRLAGLYTDARNYILATQAYRRFLELSRDPERRREMSRELADLCYRRVGCYDEAARLYSALIAESAEREPQQNELRARNELRTEQYRMLRNVAALQRRFQRTTEEERALDAARAAYARIRADYDAEQAAFDELEKRVFELKRQLLNRENEQLEREYYRLVRIEQPAVRERLGYLQSRLDSLDLASLLEERAMVLIRQQRYRDAQGIYGEIIAGGRAEQAMRARRNIEALNLTLQDGRLRNIEMPADYQR